MKVPRFHAPNARRLLPFLLCAVAGCISGPPRLFPVAPISVRQTSDQLIERCYDTDNDRRTDTLERLSSTGMVESIARTESGKSGPRFDIRFDAIPPNDTRHLLVILDSVPFSMVQELRDQGRFRLFHPPARVIAPFPVMTDLSLAEFFGVSPCPGVESSYYDGKRLLNGYEVYAAGGNVPWHAMMDWYLWTVLHADVYLNPYPWYDHELTRVQVHLERRSAEKRTNIYIVSTSAIGAKYGRDGHQAALVRLDRFCQQLAFESRGRLRITLMSDHGHALIPSRLIPLPKMLERFGYRVTEQLERPGDVVVPEFGIITCASIHTREPARVAADVLGIEGIELSAYSETPESVVVLSRAGQARITRPPGGFAYVPQHGDPLALLPIIEKLRADGRMAGESIDDRVLFEATQDHVYPDAVARLWRAFHGLVQHPPDVLISTLDGYHCGSPLMSKLIPLIGAHGSLRDTSSTGFAMSMSGPLPGVVRMSELRASLKGLGLPLE